MLAGVPVTLEKLERQIAVRIMDEKKSILERRDEMKNILDEIKATPKLIENDKGERIANEEYYDLVLKNTEIQQSFLKSQNLIDKMNIQLDELASIEERAKRNGEYIDKKEKTIILNLNDLALYGIELEAPTEGVK